MTPAAATDRRATTQVARPTPARAAAHAPPPPFGVDPHPGRPKILFVGLSESTHTHSWVDLLDGAGLNVRLFALPSGVPPVDWPVRTYVTASTDERLDARTRRRLYAAGRLRRYAKKGYARFLLPGPRLESRYLAKVILDWRPDVIHTFGVDAAEFYFATRKALDLRGIGRWVLQTRGGSDLALARFDPTAAPRIAELLSACDQLLSDNEQNFDIALGMGVRPEQLSAIGTVPGTGGVNVAALSAAARGLPSSRRVIVWPKAYECPWSKALPVLEALTLAWERIQPVEIHMLAMVQEEVRMWFRALPDHVRRSCRVAEQRVPRAEVLDLAARARVMLAPSLVDGTPNSLFEAMAAGAFPIVSPLETITPIVRDGEHVLFARNLYPQEIAGALVRAMTDDALVDGAARRNLDLVRRVADRATIAPRVVSFYEELAARRAASGAAGASVP